MERPGITDGLRHIASFCRKFRRMRAFLCRLDGNGMRRPDEDNVSNKRQ